MMSVDTTSAPGAPTTRPRSGRPGAALRRQAIRAVKGLVGILVLVGLWELLRRLEVLPSSTVPSTGAVLSSIKDGVGDGTLVRATAHTLLSWAIGLALAVVIGLPLGFVIGLSRWADAATREVIDFLRPIPSVAFVPVALVFLGFGLRMEVVLILFGAIWPILFNARYGVQDVDPQLIETGRSLHLSVWRIMVRIRLVAAAPAILTGLRTASSIALILAVSAETLAVPQGLGNVIAQSATLGTTSDAYAAIVITGVLGVLMNLVITVVRARIVRWDHRTAEGGA